MQAPWPWLWVIRYEECPIQLAKQIESAKADGDAHTITIEEFKQEQED